MKSGNGIQFILNADDVQADVPAGCRVLDYLRDIRGLSGTREGCREGDCGACVVLVGELVEGRLRYQPMTSCLVPMGELEGKHLVTIEGLNHPHLSLAQSMLRDCGATQCGYCTPGFVMSLTAWMLDASKPLATDGLEDAISGNLCRCTGYRPIKQAGRNIADQLKQHDLSKDRIHLLCEHFALPDYFPGIGKRLQDKSKSAAPVTSPNGKNTVMAGATDLYMQPDTGIEEEASVSMLKRHSGDGAVRVEDRDIIIDATMTFEAFFNHPVLTELFPGLHRYRKQVASWPVRCRATLGGNVCNASPVADIGGLLLVLDASVEIATGNEQHCMPLTSFYGGNRTLNKTPEAIITTIRIKKPKANTRLSWLKVSKRFSLDIATLGSGMTIAHDGDQIIDGMLSFSGVASVPLYLEKTSRALQGKTISHQTALDMAAMVQTEIAPISDVRGSARYRRLLARQMVIAHFMQQFPDYLDEASLYEALR